MDALTIAFSLFKELKTHQSKHDGKTAKEKQEYDLVLFEACLNAVKGEEYTIPE